jgi:hypothetical protein
MPTAKGITPCLKEMFTAAWNGCFKLRKKLSAFIILLLMACTAIKTTWAGPYAPATGETGSYAIHMDDTAFISWATALAEYVPGENVDETWQTPLKALGKAEGNSFDVVSLGDGGMITLIFDPPIENKDGWDFAVFENSFSDTYLELAYVEVSSNGEDFVRFDNVSLTSGPVTGFGSTDPTNVDGLAGKYRQGYGVPFDLDTLYGKAEVISGAIDLSAISHIRVIDIVGDGTCFDSRGEPVFDPYPTYGSGGFDLDAVGVSNGADYPEGEYIPPEVPTESGDAGFGGERGCFITTLCNF